MNVNFYINAMKTWDKTKPVSYRDSIKTKDLAVKKKSQDTVTISSEARRKPAGVEEKDSRNRVEQSTDSGAEETAFPSDCIGVVKACKEVAKCFSAIEEHYAKQADQARKYADPEKHMWRKYWDSSYKHYEKGLTEKERELAYGNERAAYRGEKLNLSMYDPFIIKTNNGPGTGICSVDYALNGRLDMNNALNRIFRENGIVIPDDADLKLTVDPYDFYVWADGVEQSLAEKIEAALNQEENGYNLYYHISACNPANYGMPSPPQYEEGDVWKAGVFISVKESTGYDLRDLERRDGDFWTPDGQKVWDLMKSEYKNELCYVMYKILADDGWDSIPDRNLSIGYKQDSLYDLETSNGYGPGQTAWIDQKRADYQAWRKNYMEERAVTIAQEAGKPNKYERLMLRMGAPEEVAKLDKGFLQYAENSGQKTVSRLTDALSFDSSVYGMLNSMLNHNTVSQKVSLALLTAQMNGAFKPDMR